MKNTSEHPEETRIFEAIEEMRATMGDSFSLDSLNLAELERRTGVSRSKLRRLKRNGFAVLPHANTGRKSEHTVLTGYSGMLDSMLSNGISNSSVCYDRLQDAGYCGSLTSVKNYINRHKGLIPAKRHLVEPQGNRGRRYTTPPGEAFQMDWGFVKVQDHAGNVLTAACFAMICHHCGERYVEFFPNAKQENLFIGIIHAFQHMGIPTHILTDNMKSVVVRRDMEGKPVWQKDYEIFMRNLDFATKLCKPRHPFTKGKVERLVRFVKENFLVGRIFWNVTDLNRQALEWCNRQNGIFHRAIGGIPHEMHTQSCLARARVLKPSGMVQEYLCPMRRISFDGFVNYEGRRFGVPYSYTGNIARVMRQDGTLYIYSEDLSQMLTAHEVTWSRHDSFCKDQYATPDQPEEHPSVLVRTHLQMIQPPAPVDSFEKFNFDKGVTWDE